MNDDALNQLLDRLERIEGLVVYPTKKQSSFEWLSSKLREQGTQRGLLMLVGSLFPLLGLGLEVEDTIAIMSAIFAIIGVQNVITEG
jgi:hypothetical protein